MARQPAKQDPAALAVAEAWALLREHPLFAPMVRWGVGPVRDKNRSECPPEAWAVISSSGQIHAHPTRRGSEKEWTWVLAHLLVHLGMGHVDESGMLGDEFDSAASCVAVDRFLSALGMGAPPEPLASPIPSMDETKLARTWRESGKIPDEWAHRSVGGVKGCARARTSKWGARLDEYPHWFAAGLSNAATAAVEVAGGARSSLSGKGEVKKAWELALSWFVANYPLMGALASGLKLVADAELCASWDIRVAAVNPSAGEIYINPMKVLTVEEWKFVLAHEMLHAALGHDRRAGGRDPYYFNAAADYQINGWLKEMRVGSMPEGLLYDPELAGLSSEEIYDIITKDLRKARKLMTLRGAQGKGDDKGDILSRRIGEGDRAEGVDLDEFYRRALSTGMISHQAGGRGLLPAGLVAEIKALEHPPLSWDAQLARWFEEHVAANEPRRTWTRLSRRQSATPEIPRAGWHMPEELETLSTFGVVLDTSGSMSHKLLGQALGAIASYAASRNVPRARLICCDADSYDQGWIAPEDIAGRVEIRGRGGTVLQPGIEMLDRAKDFPADGPVLIITDGEIDVMRIKREHAFLIPEGAKLPFTPQGPVFRVSEAGS